MYMEKEKWSRYTWRNLDESKVGEENWWLPIPVSILSVSWQLPACNLKMNNLLEKFGKDKKIMLIRKTLSAKNLRQVKRRTRTIKFSGKIAEIFKSLCRAIFWSKSPGSQNKWKRYLCHSQFQKWGNAYLSLESKALVVLLGRKIFPLLFYILWLINWIKTD